MKASALTGIAVIIFLLYTALEGFHSIGPYNLLRASVFLYSIYMAYHFHNERRDFFKYAYLAAAFIMNPIFEIYLERSLWETIDIVIAALIGLSVIKDGYSPQTIQNTKNFFKNKTVRNSLIIVCIFLYALLTMQTIMRQGYPNHFSPAGKNDAVSSYIYNNLDPVLKKHGLRIYTADTFSDPGKNFVLDLNFNDRFIIAQSDKDPHILTIIPQKGKFISVKYTPPMETPIYWNNQEPQKQGSTNGRMTKERFEEIDRAVMAYAMGKDPREFEEDPVDRLNRIINSPDHRFVKLGGKTVLASYYDAGIIYTVCSPKVTVHVQTFCPENPTKLFDGDVILILSSIMFKE